MVVKLGTLYPDGKMDDLGEVNGGMRPGKDSARRAEEYGWECIFDGSDSEQCHASGRVEDTGELQYVLGIKVDQLPDSNRTLYTSELTPGCKYGSKDDLFKKLLGLEGVFDMVKEWIDQEDYEPDTKDLEEWAEDQVEEIILTQMWVGLVLVPVGLPEKSMRELLDVGETFIDEYLIPKFKEDGDWRCAVQDMMMCGHYIHLKEWVSELVDDGEWPEDTIQVAKEAALQVNMMLGLFLDQRMNAIGETGWDWLRNMGWFTCGDEVVWMGVEGKWVLSYVDGEEKTCTLTPLMKDGDDEEVEDVPLSEVKNWGYPGKEVIWKGHEGRWLLVSMNGSEATCILEPLLPEDVEDVPLHAIRALTFQESLQRRFDDQKEDSPTDEEVCETESDGSE